MYERDFDPYHILGVSPNADAKQINDAYRRLALRYHPDVVGNDNNNNNAKFDRLTQARERALRRVGGATTTGGSNGYYYSGWREATRHSSAGENFYHKYDHLYERRTHPMHVGRQYGGGVLLLWSLSLVCFGSFLWELSSAEHKVGPATEKRREKRRKEEFARREKAREIGRMERGGTSGGMSGASGRKKKTTEKVVPEMMSMMGGSRHVARLEDGGVLFVEDEEDEEEEKFDRKGYYETTTTTKSGSAGAKFKRVKPFVSRHAERTKQNALAQKNLSAEEIEKALEQMRTMEREIECCAKCGWPLPYQSTMSCPACGARTIQKRDVVRVVINKKQQLVENNDSETSENVAAAAARASPAS
jgi:predicted RNA-binding Zn-ribbon protein involved in translation (DUF1610 family)